MSNDYAMSNRNLSSELKSNISQLLSRCTAKIKDHEHLAFVAASFERLLSNLDNVEVEKRSALLGNNLGYKDEVIHWTEDLRKKQGDVDVANVLIRDVIAQSMNNSSNALKKGLSSIVTNNLIGNDSDDSSTFDEEVIVTLLSECYGFDNVMAYAVKGELNLEPEEKERFEDVVELMEYNYQFRQRSKISNLAHIQFKVIDRFVKKEDLDEVKLENFKLNLATNGEMFSNEGIKYEGLEDSVQYFDTLTEKMEFNNKIK